MNKLNWFCVLLLAVAVCGKVLAAQSLPLPAVDRYLRNAEQLASATLGPGLDLHTMSYLFSKNFAETGEEHFAYCFWQPASVVRARTNDIETISVKAILVDVSLPSGQASINQMNEQDTVNWKTRHNSVKYTAAGLTGQFPFQWKTNVPPDHAGSYSEADRTNLLRVARMALVRKQPELGHESFRIFSLNYECSVSDFTGNTNRLFYLTLAPVSGHSVNDAGTMRYYEAPVEFIIMTATGDILSLQARSAPPESARRPAGTLSNETRKTLSPPATNIPAGGDGTR